MSNPIVTIEMENGKKITSRRDINKLLKK